MFLRVLLLASMAILSPKLVAQPLQRVVGNWELTCSNHGDCVLRSLYERHTPMLTLNYVNQGPASKTTLRLRRPEQSVASTEINIGAQRWQLEGKQYQQGPQIEISQLTLLQQIIDAMQKNQQVMVSGFNRNLSLQGFNQLLRLAQTQADEARPQAKFTAQTKAGERSPNKDAPLPAPISPHEPHLGLTDQEVNRLAHFGYWEIDQQQCSLPPYQRQITTLALSPQQALLTISCEKAAYNTFYLVYLVNRQPPYSMQQMKFFMPLREGDDSVQYTLPNIDYDAAHKTLHSFFYGRGLGDCGNHSEWQFAGHHFQLARYSKESVCDGWHQSADWPELWSKPEP